LRVRPEDLEAYIHRKQLPPATDSPHPLVASRPTS
jgi:hypothetical protein